MRLWIALSLLSAPMLHSHCQMPCGIYHDEMVYDQVDQFVETAYKAITVLSDSKFATAQERNEFVRWVMQKDKMSDEMASLITTYFLQQKIKPGEDDTVKRITAAHKLLNYLMTIKQTVDMQYVNAFSEEWDKFKLMFHVEGYECKIEKAKLAKWQAEKKASENKQTADDLHDDLHQKGIPHTH